MRALLVEESFSSGELIISDSDQLKHLLNVLRLKENKEVLLLNGKGLSANANIVKINKREIVLEILSVNQHKRKDEIYLFCSLVKKESMESILVSACELGVYKIIPFISKYSITHPYKDGIFFSSARIKKILRSGIEQSNNPFLPEIGDVENFDGLLKKIETLGPTFYLSERPKQSGKISLVGQTPAAVLIGPEGGFSSDEDDALCDNKNTIPLHIPGAIMRSTTASVFAIGHLRCALQS